MSRVLAGLNTIDKFISIAKELPKLKVFLAPQFKSAAKGLCEICQKLLMANEKLSNWVYQLRYIGFNNIKARSNFLQAIRKYREMISGPEFHQWKISCGDIESRLKFRIDLKIQERY